MSLVPEFGGTGAEQLSAEIIDSNKRVDNFGTFTDPNPKDTDTDFGGFVVRKFPPYNTNYGSFVK